MKKKFLIRLLIIGLFIFVPTTVFALAAACPLGPEVTKDLKGVLKIMQIIGPVVMFVFTVWDLIRAISKGEVEKELKPIWNRTSKRLIATFALFFIPLLVNTAFTIFGIYDSELCNFDNGVNTSSGEGGETARSCADKGYTFIPETKKCGKKATKEQICNAYNGRVGDNEDRAKCEALGCTYNFSRGKCNAKVETECYLLNGQPGNIEHQAKCEARTGCKYDFTTGKCNQVNYNQAS